MALEHGGGSEKRPRGSPTGITPRKDPKRRSSQPRSQRQLFTEWTDRENSALVEFVLLSRPDNSWPADKSTVFWDNAAHYTFIRSGSAYKRSGI